MVNNWLQKETSNTPIYSSDLRSKLRTFYYVSRKFCSEHCEAKDRFKRNRITHFGIQCRGEVSFRFHIGRDVADHAETLSWRRNWYVNETDLFVTSLGRLIGTWIKPTNLRRRNDVPINILVRLTNLTRRRQVTTNT